MHACMHAFIHLFIYLFRTPSPSCQTLSNAYDMSKNTPVVSRDVLPSNALYIS